MEVAADSVKDAGLTYVSDKDAGIARKGSAGKFHYLDAKGNRIKDEATLERIKKIVIPPAWTNVWIAPTKNGYLQAVGFDAAGRKQYKYHVQWTSRRSDKKYFRLLAFGKVLGKARKHIARDLKRKELDQQKVLAICLEVIQKTLIRIGNESYKQLYGSYGLTTLRDKHVKISGAALELNFIGKKGVKQNVAYHDRKLANLVKKCRDIPGQELFQYYRENGERCSIGTTQINNYIREITGSDFTAKDFRTWGGTMEALKQMAICERDFPTISQKKKVNEVLDCVARRLGNTRAVCKSSYVYPALLNAFEEGKIKPYLKGISMDNEGHTEKDEQLLMKFLRATNSL